jgi:hypothetical protein
MAKRKAVYYGQVELIPGIVCDGYVLDDDTAVMSERGTADLLGVDHTHLNRVATNWPPKTLEPFVDKALSVATNSVEVVANNSPHKGRKISIYNASVIENLIRTYVLSRSQTLFGNACLNALHCTILIYHCNVEIIGSE